ncbi:hypothetical protein Tco_0085562 [Tanacetum coccineum]
MNFEQLDLARNQKLWSAYGGGGVPLPKRERKEERFFDTSAGNPVKEILLKLNLPDNMSILTDLKVTPTNHWRMIKPYSSPRFIANCFNAGYLKIEVKRQSVKVKEIQIRCIIKAFQDYQIKKDWYGYDTIEEYLEETCFPSTDKDSTDVDTIHESYSPMSKGKYVPVSQKHNPKVKSHIPIIGCVLGLANVTTWDEILKKMGVRKPEIYADKAKGKRKVASKHLQLAFASKYLQVTSKYLQLAFAACTSLQASICRLHLKIAFAGCKQAFTAYNCNLQLQLAIAAFNCNFHLHVSICRLQASICSLQLQLAFAACTSLQASKQAFADCIFKHLQVSSKHLQLEFAAGTSLQASICRLHLQPFVGCKQAFATCICSLQLQLAFAACN